MSRQASIADIQVVTAEIERRLGKRGVRVQYSGDIPTAYATKDSVVLPQLRAPVTEEELAYHRYKALHETGHHMRHDVFEFGESLAPGALSETRKYLWNLLEDEALEGMIAKAYRGDRMTLSRGRSIHVTRMLTALQEAKGGFDEDGTKCTAAYVVALSSRNWHVGLDGLLDAVRTILPREVVDLSDELLAEGWAERVADTCNQDVPTVWDTACELHKRLFPDAEEPQQSEKPQQNDEEEGDTNQGDGGEGGEEAQQNPPPSDVTDNNDSEEGEAPAEGHREVNWKDLLASDHEEMLDPSKATVHITYDPWTTDAGVFHPDDEVVEAKRERCRYLKPVEFDSSIANQMRRHIQSQSRAKWETERRSGRLNKRALKRIVMGTEDRHRRVFQKREDAKAIDTAITVLVDCSGSMEGMNRYQLANKAAATVAECFDNVLKVPVEVIGHTYHGGKVWMTVAKKFGERTTPEDVYDYLCGVQRIGNADGDALLWAARRLAKRPERRKIVLVIADGQPADLKNWEGCPSALLKVAIEETKRMGIETYGIGIGYPDMQQFFEGCEYVEDGGDITGPLLRAAEKFVERR
jgi:cobalamin biosynthesis protein CobT